MGANTCTEYSYIEQTTPGAFCNQSMFRNKLIFEATRKSVAIYDGVVDIIIDREVNADKIIIFVTKMMTIIKIQYYTRDRQGATNFIKYLSNSGSTTQEIPSAEVRLLNKETTSPEVYQALKETKLEHKFKLLIMFGIGLVVNYRSDNMFLLKIDKILDMTDTTIEEAINTEECLNIDDRKHINNEELMDIKLLIKKAGIEYNKEGGGKE